MQNINNYDFPLFGNHTSSSSNDDFIEILGLKLHFDDLIIICLLFFLYKEGVHDNMLFLALILLLIT